MNFDSSFERECAAFEHRRKLYSPTRAEDARGKNSTEEEQKHEEDEEKKERQFSKLCSGTCRSLSPHPHLEGIDFGSLFQVRVLLEGHRRERIPCCGISNDNSTE